MRFFVYFFHWKKSLRIMGNAKKVSDFVINCKNSTKRLRARLLCCKFNMSEKIFFIRSTDVKHKITKSI